mmetsp:Transcript_53468/g.155891  ORF Transcript_53468/g.155891 Transcript_53468/m.155891 type:complete len:344 (-) Transcript_53468:385-1416(-)
MGPGREEDNVAGGLLGVEGLVQHPEERQAAGVDHAFRKAPITPSRKVPTATEEGVVHVAKDLDAPAEARRPLDRVRLGLEVPEHLLPDRAVDDVLVDKLVEVVVTSAAVDEVFQLDEVRASGAGDEPHDGHLPLRAPEPGLLEGVNQDGLGGRVQQVVMQRLLRKEPQHALGDLHQRGHADRGKDVRQVRLSPLPHHLLQELVQRLHARPQEQQPPGKVDESGADGDDLDRVAQVHVYPPEARDGGGELGQHDEREDYMDCRLGKEGRQQARDDSHDGVHQVTDLSRNADGLGVPHRNAPELLLPPVQCAAWSVVERREDLWQDKPLRDVQKDADQHQVPERL